MTVQTIKFSQFADGGTLGPNQTTVGLDNTNTINTRFLNAFPNLPAGSTPDRPPITPQMYFRLRFNTTLLAFEYYNSFISQWVQLEDSLNISAQAFITYTNSPLLSSAFDLGSLDSGILKQTVFAGVSTPSIAINGTDYYAPGFTGYISAPAGIADILNNPVVNFRSIIGASNVIALGNSPSGSPPSIAAEGFDIDIGIDYNAQNNGVHNFISTNVIPVSFMSGTSSQHTTEFSFANTANLRTVSWPDADGTVAFSSINTSFIPTITFATPGDLSVVYTIQTCTAFTIANTVEVNISISFTPTYTTASGQFEISLPNTVSIPMGGSVLSIPTNNLIFPAGTTMLSPEAISTQAFGSIRAIGSSVTQGFLDTTNILSGTTYSFNVTFLYLI